jgi:hypothetical protein
MRLLERCRTVVFAWSFAFYAAFTSLVSQDARPLFLPLPSVSLAHECFTRDGSAVLQHIPRRLSIYFLGRLELQHVILEHLLPVVLQQFFITLSTSLIWQVRNLFDEGGIDVHHLGWFAVRSACFSCVFGLLADIQHLAIHLGHWVALQVGGMRVWPRVKRILVQSLCGCKFIPLARLL